MDVRRVMTQATQKEQATTTLKKNLLTSSERFTSVSYGFHFWIGEPKCGDNIHHTVLSGATGLESPKSLASDRASFLDSFSSIGFHFTLALRFNTSFLFHFLTYCF